MENDPWKILRYGSKIVEKCKLFRNRKNRCFGGNGLCGMYEMHVYFFIHQILVEFRVFYENYKNHNIKP